MVHVKNTVYKMRKVLITGASGFIGRELIPKLKDKYELHTLERYVTGRYSLDSNSKAQKLLGREPQYSLEEGLKKTIAYWRLHE